jgi:YbbR domain-containing protein
VSTISERFIAWLRPKKKPGKNQWVMVSISFLLAVTLWFLVTMNSQSYSTTFHVPIKLINFPDSLQLLKEFPEELEVDTRGVGIQLLYQKWEPEDTIYLDFNEVRDKRRFVPRANLAQINQVLQSGVSTTRVRPDTISLAFLRKANKRVPIVLDMVLNMPPSYRVTSTLRPDRDSVLIVGPEASLKNIHSWKTVQYVTSPIRSRQVLYVPMDTIPPFTVLPKEVPVTVEPRPYTERVLSVAVNKVNLPRNTLLRLETDSVYLRFLLPMDEYDVINEGSFRFEADFESINQRSDFLIPTLAAFPPSVLIKSFTPRLLRYTIVETE